MPPRKRKLPATNQAEQDNTDDENESTAAKKTKKTFSIFDTQKSATKNSSGKTGGEWLEHGEPVNKLKPLFYHYYKDLPGCTKIAAFDIDFTIIKTKTGKKFPKDANDWTWFHKSVVESLRDLNTSGYRVVFITNQAGIEKGRAKFAELKSKFDAIIAELEIPVIVYVATGENHFRKPSSEIWQFFLSSCNKSVAVDMAESFYVGDAAGRPKGWAAGKDKDFSCVDRMFAYNCGLRFMTPEEFFLKEKPAKFEWRSINPEEVLKNLKPKEENDAAVSTQYHKKEKEVILFVGPPASGKTTFTKRNLLPFNYVHVNRDTLATQDKCLKTMAAALAEGKSVVIDNTNPAKAVRSDYINLAKKSGVKHIRCFKMNTEIELCHHLNYVRQNQSKGKIRRVPDVGYNTYKSRYEEPDTSEGFTEILQIEFSPEFDSEENEKIFKQWTD